MDELTSFFLYASERHMFLVQTPFGFSYVLLSCSDR